MYRAQGTPKSRLNVDLVDYVYGFVGFYPVTS